MNDNEIDEKIEEMNEIIHLNHHCHDVESDWVRLHEIENELKEVGVKLKRY